MDASLLAGWENFYVITGSCAGGLIGLMFVVVTLIREASRVKPEGLRAFVTPTIVHFGAVLALSAFLSMPHLDVVWLSVGFAVAGIAGLVYCMRIKANLRGHSGAYKPVFEDWLFNVAVPAVLYGASIAAAVTVRSWTRQTLYGIALIALALLFTGIRNSWDIAVYMLISSKKETD